MRSFAFYLALAALSVFSSAALAQDPSKDSLRISEKLLSLSPAQSKAVSIRFRENAVALGRVPVLHAVRSEFESQPQVILTGRITRLADREFELDAGPRGKHTIAYDDVAEVKFAVAPAKAERSRADEVMEAILLFPFRLIYVFLLGGWCNNGW